MAAVVVFTRGRHGDPQHIRREKHQKHADEKIHMKASCDQPLSGKFQEDTVENHHHQRLHQTDGALIYHMRRHIGGDMQPVRCSRLITCRSLQTSWMELKIPIQIQAVTMAKNPVRVLSLVTNMESFSTKERISDTITANRMIFQFFSLTKIRKNFPT